MSESGEGQPQVTKKKESFGARVARFGLLSTLAASLGGDRAAPTSAEVSAMPEPTPHRVDMSASDLSDLRAMPTENKLPDLDRDGIPNAVDPDMDGDKLSSDGADHEDANPNQEDPSSRGQDADNDNDGWQNETDAAPENPVIQVETGDSPMGKLRAYIEELRANGVMGQDVYFDARRDGTSIMAGGDGELAEASAAYKVQSGETYTSIIRPFLEARIARDFKDLSDAQRETLLQNALILATRLEELGRFNNWTEEGPSKLTAGQVMDVRMGSDGVTRANLDVLNGMMSGQTPETDYEAAVRFVMGIDPHKLVTEADKKAYHAKLQSAGYRLVNVGPASLPW